MAQELFGTSHDLETHGNVTQLEIFYDHPERMQIFKPTTRDAICRPTHDKCICLGVTVP